MDFSGVKKHTKFGNQPFEKNSHRKKADFDKNRVLATPPDGGEGGGGRPAWGGIEIC